MLPVLLACAAPVADSGTPPAASTDDSGTGLLIFDGDATVGTGYLGTEQIRFGPTTGGDPLCLIEVPVSSVGIREDCAECLWAFDLTFSTPTVLIDTHCAAIGYDEAALAAISGSGRACGFADESLGHAEALLVETDGAWEPVSFADWSAETGALSYAWEQGYQDY